MNKYPSSRCAWFLGAALVSGPVLARAAVPPEWLVSQDVHASAPGLNRVRLSVESLGAAQGSLADLRLLDSGGKEIPFFIDQPVPEPARDLPLERMTATMMSKKTVITGMVPAAIQTTGIDAVTLLTPTADFLKPVTLEGSMDGKHWKMLTHQAPIFKQSGDPMSSTVPFLKGAWSYLRVTLDDAETPPLRVSQIRLYASGRPIKDLQDIDPKILEMASDGHRTEIRLQMPADELPIQAVRFEVADGTFRRQVRLASREFSAGEFRDSTVAQGAIYRILLGAQKTEQLTVPVGGIQTGRLVTLTIENADSPPLSIRHVRLKVIPRDLIFDAPRPGLYTLCLGNPQAPARDYDVAALRGTLGRAALHPATLSAVQPNLDYREPSVPEYDVHDEGSDINVDSWRYRKKVDFDVVSGQPALWRIELDPESVAHYGGRVEGLRLVRSDQQFPYVVEYAGVERSLAPGLEYDKSAPKGKSLWIVTLPYDGLPISRLQFTVPDPLFRRSVTLYEMAPERSEAPAASPRRRSIPRGLFGTAGALIGLVTESPVFDRDVPLNQTTGLEPEETTERRILASGSWVRIRPDMPATLELTLNQSPKSGRLILETDNGDNAPIHLGTVQAYYRAPRLLFRTKPQKAPLYLYYGQPEVSAPRYDLNLIASELLSTPPQEARMGSEEALKANPWWDTPSLEGHKKHVFWGVMSLVVLGLLWVIAKLLPEESGAKSQ